MNKKLKVGILALVIFCTFSAGVFAASYLEQISAYLNKGVTLKYNGIAFYPTEDDGTRVYPITYNGRTYVPVKYIAEKAGLGVEWDSDTMTVSLTSSNYKNTGKIITAPYKDYYNTVKELFAVSSNSIKLDEAVKETNEMYNDILKASWYVEGNNTLVYEYRYLYNVDEESARANIKLNESNLDDASVSELDTLNAMVKEKPKLKFIYKNANGNTVFEKVYEGE